MNYYENTFCLIKFPQIFLFKQYLFFNKFMITYYNQYYYIFLKSTLSEKPTHWTLFSYSVDKYYTSINLNYKNVNAYFIKQIERNYDESNYIDSLINFKRLNTTFISPQKLEDYSIVNYYIFNKYQPENLYKNPLNYTQIILDYNNSDVADNDFCTNTFKYKTKLTITENRKLLLKFLNFKLKRQYRVTKFLVKFIKFKVKNSINFFEMSLSNIVMASKFTPNNTHNQIFFKNRCVYVNGLININPLTKLNKGDCVQLVFSKNYIEFFFDWFNSLSKLNIKYYNKFFKKFDDETQSSDTDDENIKTLHPHDSKKAQILTFFKKPFPEFLEIDFLTLSTIVIYTPSSMYFLNDRVYYTYNHYLNRLYNWKYLT